MRSSTGSSLDRFEDARVVLTAVLRGTEDMITLVWIPNWRGFRKGQNIHKVTKPLVEYDLQDGRFSRGSEF